MSLSYNYDLYVILNTATIEQLFMPYREIFKLECCNRCELLKLHSELLETPEWSWKYSFQFLLLLNYTTHQVIT